MKKIFLAFLMVAALSVCGYSRDVRVVMKSGLERKGALTATNEDSVFIKFKNGRVRKIPFTEITSVIDAKINADILSAIQAEGKVPAERTPAAVKAPAAEKGSAVLEAAPGFTPAASKQKGLPDNLMGWMAERYGSKTMLGLKWEHPTKAKNQYVAENNAAFAFALANPGMQKPRSRGRSAAAVNGPAASLDIAFTASFVSDAFTDPVVNSYLDVKFRQNAKPGGMTCWNIGYLKYSVTEDVWDDVGGGYQPQTTKASVVSATFVLAMPTAFSLYGFAGPAMVSYDKTSTGAGTTTPGYIDWSIPAWVPEVYTPGAESTTSGTAITWIAGMGYSLRLSDSGFGIFAEFKHIPETGNYPGMTNMGLGLTLGF